MRRITIDRWTDVQGSIRSDAGKPPNRSKRAAKLRDYRVIYSRRPAIVDHTRWGAFRLVTSVSLPRRAVKIWKVAVLPDLRYVFALEC